MRLRIFMTISKVDEIKKEFLEEMKELLGDEYDLFLNSFEDDRTNAIRVNTLKISVDDFLRYQVFPLGQKVPWSDVGFYISLDERPGKSPMHDAGAFYIQEPSAMSVVGQTDIKEGEFILDMCAAPGGKSTYILQKLNNTGILVSNEINPSRAKSLCDNMERFGAINSIVTNTDSKGLLKFFKGYFDKVFIDAPCSGSGMFRKDDGAIYDWSLKKELDCAQIQSQLLEDAYYMVKSGGTIVYSTCTFSKRENEDSVERFLENHRDLDLLSMGRIWPHREKGEGHFCARIKKSAESDEDTEYVGEHNEKLRRPKKSKNKKGKDSKNIHMNYFYNFVEKYISNNSILRNTIENGVLKIRGEFIFLEPFEVIDLNGLKVLRRGLLLGEFKKNRFEPSHSLAMAMNKNDSNLAVDFGHNSMEITKYLAGEVIDCEIEDGWVLVCVDGVGLGWAKSTRGKLKNKLPKGLRRQISTLCP